MKKTVTKAIMAICLPIFVMEFAEAAKKDNADNAFPNIDIHVIDKEAMSRIIEINALNPDDNQGVLADYMRNDTDVDVRQAAIHKITDQTILAEVSQNESEYAFIRQMAIKKLEDQTLLSELAKNSPEKMVRWEALCKLKNQKLLTEIAINDTDKDLRVAAAVTLEDKTLLVNFATTSEDAQLRRSAIVFLKDQTLIAKIAQNDTDEQVRYQAVLCLNDQKHLADFAKQTAHDDSAYQLAIKMIADPIVLAEISKNENMRKTAKNRLDELKRETIAKEENTMNEQ